MSKILTSATTQESLYWLNSWESIHILWNDTISFLLYKKKKLGVGVKTYDNILTF